MNPSSQVGESADAGEEKTINELTNPTLPFESGHEYLPCVLPGFATPDWLRDNHHLMKADLRKLAVVLTDEYPDWTADGSDAAAFWRAVHDQAEHWTWFLWVFEDRILKLFGPVKGRKKQLVSRLLAAAGDRARELHPLARAEAEPELFDDLETLWGEGEHLLVAQVVWAMSCLQDAISSHMMSEWVEDPIIDDLIGDAIHRAQYLPRPDLGHLVERLKRETVGPHLEKLIARAGAECLELHKDASSHWSRLRELVADHDHYRPALKDLSSHLLKVELLDRDILRITDARDSASARCRHAAVCARLEQAMNAMPEALDGDTARLTDSIAKIAKDGPVPLVFTEPEWKRCEELAEAFRAALVGPVEQELALREASRRYAEDPSAANREALHTAMAAERDNPRSIAPASDILDRIAAALTAMALQYGYWTDHDAWDELPPVPGSRARVRELNAEIDALKAARQADDERLAVLQATLDDVKEENDGLRSERYRLLERLAALEGGGRCGSTEEGTVPPLGSYEELPDWTAAHFAGRVALSGRAVRALKGAEFEDVGLVGKAIHMLATTYWGIKTGGSLELRDTFENTLRDLRLLETPSLRPGQQGKARDDFVIEWDRRRLTLDRHIKNRSGTRDPKRCFRLYFSWDEATRQVVIGHLPGHMNTPGT